MELKDIKQQFFALRNGIIADSIRKSGMEYRMIFGLMVPQLAQIARQIGFDPILGHQLWADTGVRESRLLATYLFDPTQITINEAMQLAREVTTREEADMLAFRLFKRMHEPQQLLATIIEDTTIPPYVSDAFRRHLE